MRLDRNVNDRGKYALIKNRVLATFVEPGPFGGGLVGPVADAIAVLEKAGVLDWGDKPETEFFVIRLKDRYANPALAAYAMGAYPEDPQYGQEVAEMAKRSGLYHPNCKKPD